MSTNEFPQAKMDELVRVIVEKCPELGPPMACVHVKPCNDQNDCKLIYTDPSLEHVLRAIDKADTKYWFNVDAEGKLAHGFSGKKYQWHLGKPLSEQSPKTINFLHSLLYK